VGPHYLSGGKWGIYHLNPITDGTQRAYGRVLTPKVFTNPPKILNPPNYSLIRAMGVFRQIQNPGGCGGAPNLYREDKFFSSQKG